MPDEVIMLTCRFAPDGWVTCMDEPTSAEVHVELEESLLMVVINTA